MKLRNLLFSLLLLSSVVPMACDKKDDDNGGGDSLKLQQLSASPWKISTATALGQNIIPLVDGCYVDNIITFYADRKGKVEEGASVCTPSRAGNFTWSFNSDETEIILSAGLLPGGNNNFKLVSVSSSTLVLSQESTLIPAPAPVEIVVTLTHP